MQVEKRNTTLPDTIKELSEFVIYNAARLKGIMAGLAAVQKTKLPGDQYKQLAAQARCLQEEQLDAEVKLGEYFAGMNKGAGRPKKIMDTDVQNISKSAVLSDLGFSVKQAQRMETLAANKPVVEQIKAEARENDDIPTRTAVLKAIRTNEQAVKNEKIMTSPVKIFNGLYDVVVVDPPWPIEKIERDCRPNQVKAIDYPVMTVEAIGAWKFPLAENAHVFLWTTQKYLPVSFKILEAWGLKYVLTMVWHKPGGFQPVGLPQYNCEFILYARHGNPRFIDLKAFPVCFEAPRGAHSEKPQYFYDLIKRVTDGRRLDDFARKERDGFDCRGNEV